MSHTASLRCTEVGVGIDTHRYFHQAEFLDSDAQPAAAGLNFEESASKAAGNGPWVDFAWLRQQVTIEQVLQHAGCLAELSKRGSQRRGRCPLHAKPGERDHCFSADVKKNVFQCFNPKCAIHGNVLDFWAAWRRLPLREAALDLAETFRLPTSPNREEEPVKEPVRLYSKAPFKSAADKPRPGQTLPRTTRPRAPY